MLQTVKDACQFDLAGINAAIDERTEQVESLELLIGHDKSAAQNFFSKTYVTTGISQLLRQGLQRLAGRNGQAAFELRQAMGGGKTHSMLALGFLAAHPDLATALNASITEGFAPEPATVIVVSGRNIDKDKFLWGTIAQQLGKEEEFADFWKNGAIAPNEADWMNLIGDKPVLILIDELPFYLRGAVTRQVGGGTLGDVTSTAVANLLSAAIKLPKLCIVMATLSTHYEQATAELSRLLREITSEAQRQAKPITPVELGSDEIYHILRKRLMTAEPAPSVVESVAEQFGTVIADAIKSKTLEKSAQQIEGEIEVTYPFHPSFKSILATFKENEGFRQTRGLMTIAALMIRSALSRSTNDVYLLGPQHLDLADRTVRDTINNIYDLDAAITQDIADAGAREAHAQTIDANSGNDAASQAARLILMASLAEASDAVKGLVEADILSYLVAPNRSETEFRAGLDALVSKSWYLHKRDNGAWYFSRNENLTKKIEKYAETAPQPKIDAELDRRLEQMFVPKRKIAYGKVLPQPKLDEIDTRRDRVLIVLSPDNKLPPETAGKLFADKNEKNNFAVVSGDGHSLSSAEDKIRTAWAIAKVLNEEGANSPNRIELEERLQDAEKDAYQTIASTLNKLYYPGMGGGNAETLIGATLRLDNYRQKDGAGYDGETAVEEALVATGTAKLEVNVSEAYDKLVHRAEVLLWPQGERRARWADVEDLSLSAVRWLWLPRGGLDELKRLALSKGRWRDNGDGWIEKGPFPKEKTSVRVNDRNYERSTGTATIEVTAHNAGARARIHWSKTADVSDKSPVLENAVFDTSDMVLHFLAVDPDRGTEHGHDTGEPYTWRNKLALTYEAHPVSLGYEVELTVKPSGTIRWNTTGITPSQGDVYSGPIKLDGKDDTVIYAYAEAEGVTITETFKIGRREGAGQKVDPERPANIRVPLRVDTTTKVFEAITKAKDVSAHFQGVTIVVGSGSKALTAQFGPDVGLQGKAIEDFISSARAALDDQQAEVDMRWKAAHFERAADIDVFIRTIGEEIAPSDIEQL